MMKHPFPPLYRGDSKILILGSFPSVKSRQQNFFYGHPQNRFWRVLAGVLDEEVPNTIEDKKDFLYQHGIALWDVLAACEIEGSADSSIKNAVPNDLSPILTGAQIRAVFVNGRTAEKYYRKYIQPLTGRQAICLPSTSPANAAWTEDRLKETWRIITDFL